MKTSLVITVFNEERTIDKLLSALTKQTKTPEEIIIVDGGSRDKTIDRLKKFKNESTSMIQIIEEKSTTIAQGRNIGIREAIGDIIVMTDGGCIPHKDWFEKMIEPFNDPLVDVVAGFYRMTGETIFQKCLACYLGILPERLDPQNFLPSARSIAFKKEIWQKVGEFSEKLDKAGEDTLFNYQAKRLGAKFVTASEALVDWEVPNTPKEAIYKFYIYAKGDGQASIWWHPSQRLSTHNLKISSIYARYLLGLVLFLLGFYAKIFWWLLFFFFLAYLIWAVFKNYQAIKRRPAVFYLPVLQIISDLCVMAGFLSGRLKRAV